MSNLSSGENTLRPDAEDPRLQSTTDDRIKDKDQGVPLQDPPHSTTEDGPDIEKTLDPSPEGKVYPGPLKQACITGGLALGIFLYGLDGTILATAIPKITDEFGAFDDVGWYAAAYFMTSSAFQLVFGKMYTIFLVKVVYFIALGLFELGSLVCATAPNSPALIVGRVLAGIGASGLYSGSVVILAHSAPLEKRPLLTGVLAAALGVASVVGPFLGGAFTDNVTWRWCFYINLPFGAVTFVLIGLFVSIPRDQRYKGLGLWALIAQLDLPGLLVLVPSIICLLLALQWGGIKYVWSNGNIIALLVVAIFLMICFVLVEMYTPKTRAVGSSIFKSRTPAFAALYGGCLFGAFQSMIYYLPIWFQGVQQVSALESGIRNIPLILGFMVFAVVAGGVTNMLGYYTPFMIVGSILTAIGAGLLSTLTTSSGPGQWIGYQVMFGFGIGAGVQQSLLAVQTVLPEHDIPIGVTLVTLMQSLFGAIFVAVAQNVLQNQLSRNIQAIVPTFNANALLQAGVTRIGEFVPQDKLALVLSAYNKAVTQTFYVPVAIACISIIGALGTEWKSVKKGGAQAEGANTQGDDIEHEPVQEKV